MNKLFSIIISSVFIATIALFFLNQQFGFIADLSYNENKKKAEKPAFDVNKLDFFPKKYEEYFTDNFKVRGYFVNSMGWIYSNILNKSAKPDKVIIGKDKWLFDADKEQDNYYGKRNFNGSELETVLNEFIRRKKILDEMGIKMLVVITPTKQSVYPEYLPDNLISNNKNNSATQLIKCIQENTDIDIFYAADYLILHKNEHNLFFKSDNHWNYYAGYYVSNEIIRRVDSTITIISQSLFCKNKVKGFIGNLANMTAMASNYAEDIDIIQLCENDAVGYNRIIDNPSRIDNHFKALDYLLSYKSLNSNLPNAIIIRDSFSDALLPYLRNYFYHSTFIFDDWRYELNIDIIEKEQPDVVIFQVLESLIPNIHNTLVE